MSNDSAAFPRFVNVYLWAITTNAIHPQYFRGRADNHVLNAIIGHLTKQHAAVRSTFHPPTGACDSLESYIAVHEAEKSPPNIEVIFDERSMEQAVHRGFNLFEEFPVRRVVLQNTPVSAGTSKTSVSLSVVGHHIALDGVSALFIFGQ